MAGASWKYRAKSTAREVASIKAASGTRRTARRGVHRWAIAATARQSHRVFHMHNSSPIRIWTQRARMLGRLSWSAIGAPLSRSWRRSPRDLLPVIQPSLGAFHLRRRQPEKNWISDRVDAMHRRLDWSARPVMTSGDRRRLRHWKTRILEIWDIGDLAGRRPSSRAYPMRFSTRFQFKKL